MMMEKPGYKTTEFWLTLVCVLLTMLAASGLFGEQTTIAKVVEVGIGVLAAMGYTFVRGSVKKSGNG
jgi:hypothetical protein